MANLEEQFTGAEKVAQRVRELNKLTLDVTERNELLQSFSRLLTLTTGAKFSQVNIFDEATQYTIASDGAQFPPLPKNDTFCVYTLDQQSTLEIPDMTKDDRVKNHSAVTGSEHIRFYFGTPLVTTNKVAIGTVCIIHDKQLELTDKGKEVVEIIAKQITHHLELKNELIQSKKQIEQQRSTLKKVIHDLKTPISGIIGGLSMVDEESINPKFKKVLRITKKSSKNLIDYINNSLKKVLSNEQKSNFITASTLKKKLLSLYKLQANTKKVQLHISTEIDAHEYITTLSSGDLINIIGNLISNAIKFSSEGDHVSVNIDYKNSERNQYKVIVSDNGTGMTEKQIETISSLKHSEAKEGTNQEQGFGIGLTEALRTLTSHEGVFTIESAENKGTTFNLLFPRQH